MNENLAHRAYRTELQRVLPSTQDPNAAFTCYREAVQEVFSLTATQTDCQNRNGGSYRLPSATPQTPLAVSFRGSTFAGMRQPSLDAWVRHTNSLNGRGYMSPDIVCRCNALRHANIGGSPFGLVGAPRIGRGTNRL